MAPRCTLCELHEGAKSVLIPYRGAPHPEIMFVGIAPGPEEDYHNTNFVGPAGRLLTDIIEELQIDLDRCGFDNVVHCAPLDGNGRVKDPTPEQLHICSSYLYWKIAQVKPKVIVTLGNIPTRELINPDSFITDMRGRNFSIKIGGESYVVIPTFHPSAVIRGSPEYRQPIKDDILHAWRTACEVYWLPKVQLVGNTREVVDRILDIGDRFLAKKIHFCAEDNETNSIILENKFREESGVEMVEKALYSKEGKIVCKALATVENVMSGDWKSYKAATGFCFPAYHKESTIDMVPVTKALRRVFGRKKADRKNLEVPMGFHNHKYDGSWDQEKMGYRPRLYHDTMLGHVAIYGNSKKHGLENILFEELLFERYKHDTDGPLQELPPAERHYGNLPFELIGTRCAVDTVGCGILAVIQLAEIKRLKREKLNELYRHASESFTKTELRGNFIDVARHQHYLETYPALMQTELDYLDNVPQVQVWKMLHPTKKFKPHYYGDRSEVMYRIFNLPTDYASDEPSYHKNDTEEENPYWSTAEGVQFRLINHCRKKVTKQQLDAKGKVMVNDKGLPIEYEEYVPAPYTGRCTCRAIDSRLATEEDHTPQNYKRLQINPHEVALDYLIHQRQYSKIKTVNGNYLNKLLRYIRPDEWHDKHGIDPEIRGIIYSYLLHWVSSGRLSVREFPEQTMPVRSDGRRCLVSKWFKEGGLVLSQDGSQMELRVVAALANDEVMLQAFRDGEDLHLITAMACWQVPAEAVTSAMRSYAKTVSFRILYGGGARTLSEELGISIREAQTLIDNWMLRYPGVARFIAKCHAEAISTGQVLSIVGLIFDLPSALIKDSKDPKFQHALREAQNLPVQGPASLITMAAYNMLVDTFEEREMKSELWMMVHDANEVDCYPAVDELYLCYQYSKYMMEKKAPALFPWMICPMKTGAELGARWDGSPSVKSFTPECLKVYGRVPFVMELVSQLRKFSKFEINYYAVKNKKDINHSKRLTRDQMVTVEKGEQIVMKKSYSGDDGGDFDTGCEIHFEKPLKSVNLQ